MEPSYTFENWLNGEICLISSSSGILLKGEKMPIMVRWAQIKKTDVLKIKNKQKEIFENGVELLLDKLIRQCDINSKSTRSLESLIERLISKYYFVFPRKNWCFSICYLHHGFSHENA